MGGGGGKCIHTHRQDVQIEPTHSDASKYGRQQAIMSLLSCHTPLANRTENYSQLKHCGTIKYRNSRRKSIQTEQMSCNWVPWCQEWCSIQAPWHHCQCTTWLGIPPASTMQLRDMSCSRCMLLCCTVLPLSHSLRCPGRAALQVLEGAGPSPTQPGFVTTLVLG
jgi:hypothetical protein